MRLGLWFLVEVEQMPDIDRKADADSWLDARRTDPEWVGGSVLPYPVSRKDGTKGWRATAVYLDRGHNRGKGRYRQWLSAEEMQKHGIKLKANA